ncbi:NAD(P)-dependent oxidoreductase [Cucumibacter marinus]|uniref:NAD(P)-dependent oxidoreductase n=1 Tax=Cucumibacter marinus TaxID=1121252 RepID=UPI00040D1B59|nr:NAD(P)-dependent oxidoreductase [Cucumibacter marinus]
MSKISNIAFLGTGLMGLPMARRLADAGYLVSAWNRSPDRAGPLQGTVRVCTSPAEASENADCVISMLLDGPATKAVLLDQGVIGGARSGTLFVDMGSVDPDSDRMLAGFAKERDCGFLDAPVSGGVVGAHAGTLSIFAGGKESDFHRAVPVLRHLGRPHLMGPVGAGQIAKLGNQVIVAATIGAVAEAFHLAQAGGCDLDAFRAALRGGFADSRVLDLHGERMIQGNYRPGGRSAAQLKDLDNAAAQAERSNVELPMAETVRAAFRDLVDHHGGADMDHSAYFHWLSLRQN